MQRTGETSRFGAGDVRGQEPGSSAFIEAAIRQALDARPVAVPPLPDGYLDSQQRHEAMQRAPSRNHQAHQEDLEFRSLVSAKHDADAATILQRNRGRLTGVLWANIELGKLGGQEGGHPLHAELAAELATVAIREWGVTEFPPDVVACRRVADAWTGLNDARRAYQDRQGAA